MVPGSSGNLDENWPYWPLDASGKHTKSIKKLLMRTKEHGPVEIVDLAIDSMVDLSI